jgi:hypothetical protein
MTLGIGRADAMISHLKRTSHVFAGAKASDREPSRQSADWSVNLAAGAAEMPQRKMHVVAGVPLVTLER